MSDLFHSITTWSSSLIILIMGGLFIAFGIPKALQWKNLRYGCYCLAVSYLILGTAGLAESIMELSGKLIPIKSQLVLAVAFLQAMFFTGTSIAFIRLQLPSLKSFVIQLTAILILLTIFFLSYFFWPEIHGYIYATTVMAYVIQLTYYVIIFRKEYMNAQNRSDENKSIIFDMRIYRTIRLFYISLGIGVMALFYVLIPDNYMFTEAFTICYTIYYVYLVFGFITFLPDACNGSTVQPVPLIQTPASTDIQNGQPVTPPSITDPTEKETVEQAHTHAERRLADALDRWVKEERYLCPDAPIEDIATELGTDVYSLHDYFLTHKGILFRTWRVMLRIEKAKQLLELYPDIKIADLQLKVGFADKSYFFRRFKQVTGKTPNEYRNDLNTKKEENPS